MSVVRSTVIVRRGEPGDVHRVVEMCLEARAESVMGVQLCAADEATVTRHLAMLVATPGASLWVADNAGQTAGFLVTRAVTSDLVALEPALYIEALYVSRSARRAGVGRALMAQAAELAQQIGATDVLSLPLPGARGTQRFLARLGFAPAASHRAVSVATLQRSLAIDSARGRRSAVPKGLDELIARRKRSREGLGSGPMDLRPLRTAPTTTELPRVHRAS